MGSGAGVRVAAVLLGVALAIGAFVSTRGSAPVAPIAAAALPALPPLSTEFAGTPLAQHLAASGLLIDDEFLQSSLLGDPDFTRSVHAWIGYWTGPATEWFPGFLDRMAWMGPSVDSALASRGMPSALRYLPLIESGYDPSVTSRAGAVGLWQLMPVTARGLGLAITPRVDERRDPERSTDVALTFLTDLKSEFGSWHLTLAAYNSGPTRVRGVLRRHAAGAPRTDSLYWAIRDRLPAETREFLPKLYAAMWVASQPEAYGYAPPVSDPFRFEAVPVFYETTLDVIALAAGASHAEVVRLNPQLVRGVTPDQEQTFVRIPEGTRRRFRTVYPRVRPEDRTSFIGHVVSPGETVSEIAARYGLGVEDILGANPRVRPEQLAARTRLVVPVAAPVREETALPESNRADGDAPPS